MTVRAVRMFVLAAAALLTPLGLRGADSLWTRGAGKDGPRSLYDSELLPERKFKPNDLLLILVEENGFAANNSNINLRRKFDLQAELRKFARFDPKEFTLSAADPTSLPSIDLQSEKRQEGRGTTDRREKILFRITARVVEVLANGNLIIEAKKTRMINDEESILTLFGEVSADDVSPQTRAVRSERIADMKLVYSGRGPVSRNLGRTIISWLAEWLWPF
jgi:flagellar L-ring protein precursor FlgH